MIPANNMDAINYSQQSSSTDSFSLISMDW